MLDYSIWCGAQLLLYRLLQQRESVTKREHLEQAGHLERWNKTGDKQQGQRNKESI
jgi:hypothetical protein